MMEIIRENELWVRAGNSLIRSSLIHSFCSNQMSDCERFAQITQDKWATVSESLISLKLNERCERITHLAHQKWANMSDSLRSLRGNEQMSDLLKKCWLQNLKSCFTMFYLSFFYLKKFEFETLIFAHFLFFSERC